MNKLHQGAKWRAESYHGKRFYTARDMAIIKQEQNVINSREKRGELVRKANQYIAVCGCGLEGCFIHGSRDNYQPTTTA